MKVTKLAWVEAPSSLNRKRMIRSAATTPVISHTACSARTLYAGRSVVTVVVLFSRACCMLVIRALGISPADGRICGRLLMPWYGQLGPQGRFDVADTVPRGVANEVAGPIRTAVPPPEPLIRPIAERLDHVGLHLLVPGHHVRRPPIAPAPVDQGVDLVALQTSDFRRRFLTAEDSGAVGLPVNDVR